MKKLFVGVAINIAILSAGFGADAKANWTASCASCHGKDGSGNTAMGRKLNTKDYRDAKFQVLFSDAEIENAIKKGVKTNGKETMKPFGDKLSEADIKALVAYIRRFAKS
jgi:mono/diheme cytochrome c family protein